MTELGLLPLSWKIPSNLLSLDISICDISSTTLDSLHNLTSLLSLDLSGNQLTNMLPKSLGNFCNLRHIYLSENNFQNISLTYLLESFLECKSPCLESLSVYYSGLSGLLPDQLGQFKHLEYLQFRDNDISGTIPNSIGRLSWLEVLDLTGNQLNGSLPDLIGRFSLLKSLLLSYNQFDGHHPNSLGQLSNLENLEFSSNFLRGVVTETHFAKLVRLKYLSGDGNNLILRPQLANWVPPFQLVSLNLHTWGLGPQFPLWLQLQKDLVNLNISNTNISSPIPESFCRSLPYLSDLDISKNQIQGTLTLSGISTTLSLLDLSSNRFGGKLPDVSNGSFLMLLDLSNNLFVGLLHQFLCSDGVKETDMLSLGNNSLTGVIPECWEKWQRLSYLNLENNNFSGEIPRTLGRLRHMKSLNVHGNKLVGKLPASLMNLKYLEILELSGNELYGSIPSWIGTEISSLKLLNLRYNNFVGNIPRELCYLSHIRILDFSNNKLIGDIPRCFNNFSVLSGKISLPDYDFLVGIGAGQKERSGVSLVMKGHEYIYTSLLKLMRFFDLSNNNLVGHIPGELTTLIKLKSLNLSGNHLTGRIPEKIGDMKELESFDLSLNKLSGELPMSLSSLSSLSSFNVSYNNLTGRIPSSTQLQSFNESCFVGNELCGDPLSIRCSRIEALIQIMKKMMYHVEQIGA